MKRQPPREVDTSVDASGHESVNRWLVEIGGRIKQAREALGLTQEAFALEAGAKSKSGLQDNERGKSMPGGVIIGGLAKRLVNTNWIFTGTGEMFVAEMAYPAHSGSTALAAMDKAVRPPDAQLDPVLLQGVIDFLFRWLDEHQVKLDRSKFGAVISVMYRVASSRGRVEIHELEQVLRLAA